MNKTKKSIIIKTLIIMNVITPYFNRQSVNKIKNQIDDKSSHDQTFFLG